MKKRRSSAQEDIIEKLENTYPETILCEISDLARLEYPEKFPSNQPRLFNKLTNNCKTAMDQMNVVLSKLPDTYRAKILSDYNFDPFINNLLRSSIAVDKKSKNKKQKKGKKFQSYSFRLASSMFIKSLGFLLETMPQELQESLIRQIYPFIIQLNGFSNFLIQINPKQNLPYLDIPLFLYPPEHRPRIGIA